MLFGSIALDRLACKILFNLVLIYLIFAQLNSSKDPFYTRVW